MTVLSVNINKIATIRNSRGKNNPDVVQTALKIVAFGAHGITVHPRPDERHIRRSDVYALKSALSVELNIEGYPSEDFLRMVEEVKPAQCTLVPDPPDALTSNAGWEVGANIELLNQVAERLHKKEIRSSFFIDPATMKLSEYAQLRKAGAERVELYTEKFAETWTAENSTAGMTALIEYRKAAEEARSVGLGVNAGHDLNLHNLTALVAAIPWLAEVSIGHALICDALEYGLELTVKKYLDCIALGARRLV